MQYKSINPKPSVVWLEGILDYFNALFPHESEYPRHIGFDIGRQIVGLYLTEMLLKHALDDLNQPYDHIHGLRDLFSALPESQRCAVERKYSEILSGSVSETWDFAKSIALFLEYLGDDPMTDSRYFWERSRPRGMSIVFFNTSLRHLIYALFIGLHNYPEKGQYQKQYHTKYISFEDSLNERDERYRQDPPERNTKRADKRIRPNSFWLASLLEYFNVRFPHESGDPRTFGFQVGQRMIGLYLSEILLKYALDDLNREFNRSHNLYALFKRLPHPRRRAVAKKYDEILHNRVSSTWDYARSVESLLQYLGDNPLTDIRYFWEVRREIIPLSPRPLMPLVYALFIELHGYPQNGPLKKWYEPVFLPLEDSLRNSVTLADVSGNSTRANLPPSHNQPSPSLPADSDDRP